jgi:hypothetical protein
MINDQCDKFNTPVQSFLKDFYEKWRKSLPEQLGVNLDSKRLFDDDDRRVIYAKTDGVCGVCAKAVEAEEAEYDHFPTPHRDGGLTVPDNGRIVHKACHPRGRPPAEQ